MQAQALLFDFGGTLDADGIPWVDRFHRRYLSGGGRMDRGAFSGRFRIADQQLAAMPGITRQNYSETVTAQAGLLAALLPAEPEVDWTAIADDFTREAFATAARNRPILERLASDHSMAVVSNFQGNLGPCLAELGLADCFQVASDSALVGCRKPDARLFTVTLAQLGASADWAWMIGDSPFNDIAAAAALGFDTCWLAPADRALPGITPTVRIATLDELPAALEATCRR